MVFVFPGVKLTWNIIDVTILNNIKKMFIPNVVNKNKNVLSNNIKPLKHKNYISDWRSISEI